MQTPICAACWRKYRPLIYSYRFTPRQEFCTYCGQLNLDGFYLHGTKEKSNGDETLEVSDIVQQTKSQKVQ